ncbi:hypothetical protein [Alkalicoccus luteus]|uniref:Uncharacterized protein n=1 Tax=Alkalicoccus luteus TaxID=1237094 RepID=A0A969PT62_9BACI|nr:hypothetical protein [Alkalicoccus luteus]NJP38878.1 hypothetical protein [Alkalicoccus luteus]
MAALNWKDKLLEQNWLLPFLPNYMKPLQEPALENVQTKEFVYEAEEFISDLAALSELPRLNKTFKRSIQGFTYKIKIKPKKIHVEMLDTHKSASTIKKRVFITIHRMHIRQENGMGKVLDSTIYYQKNGRTIVRSVKRHPIFQSVFYHLHRLDTSVSGHQMEALPAAGEASLESSSPVPAPDQEGRLLTAALKEIADLSVSMPFAKQVSAIFEAMSRAEEEYQLLNIEEKHQIKRMIHHDMPNLVHTYESLTAEQRKELLPRVEQSLSNMHAFISGIADDLQRTRVDRMNHLLQLNDLRYSLDQQSEEGTSSLMKKHQRQLKD